MFGDPNLFVGYGPYAMLPFMDGSKLTFYVNEQLWVKSDRIVNIRLTDPDGVDVVERNVATKLRLWIFSDRGKTGLWKLQAMYGLNQLTMYIQVKSYEKDKVRINFNLKEGYLVSSVDEEGLNLAAFISDQGFKPVIPGQIVSLKLGTDYTGPVNVTLLRPGWIRVAGMVKGVREDVKVMPLVASYVTTAYRGLVTVWLPKLHRVGPNGLVPLRYGMVNVTLKWGESSKSMGIYVFNLKMRLEEGLGLANSVRLSLVDDILEDYVGDMPKLVVLKRSGIIGPSIDVLEATPPLAMVRVINERLGEVMDTRHYRLEADGAKVAYSNKLAYLLYQPYLEIDDGDYLINPKPVKVSLKLGGIKVLSKVISMLPLRLYEVRIKAYDVEILVKDADGKPLESSLLINGTEVGGFMGNISVRLVKGFYNLTVKSPLGSSTKLAYIDGDSRISFVIGIPTASLWVVRGVALAEVAILILLATSLKRKGKIH